LHLNNIKFPLFMLEFLKLHLFWLPMLVALCLQDLLSLGSYYYYNDLYLLFLFHFCANKNL
jgi:hypothetical protein